MPDHLVFKGQYQYPGISSFWFARGIVPAGSSIQLTGIGLDTAAHPPEDKGMEREQQVPVDPSP